MSETLPSRPTYDDRERQFLVSALKEALVNYSLHRQDDIILAAMYAVSLSVLAILIVWFRRRYHNQASRGFFETREGSGDA